MLMEYHGRTSWNITADAQVVSRLILEAYHGKYTETITAEVTEDLW